MMLFDVRALLCLVFLLVPMDGQAGLAKKIAPFPGVEYAYVRVYLMNIGAGAMSGPRSMRPILGSDGTYSRSKIGPGITLPQESVARLNRVIDGGVQDLLEGLAKCFIPRHGIVYYDAQHEPVAAVSVCFECGGVRLFPKTQSAHDEANVSPRSFTRRAEKKLAALKSILRRHGVPVYEESSEYTRYLRSAKGDDIRSTGRAVIRAPQWLAKTLGARPSVPTVQGYVRDEGIRWKERVDEASGQRHYSLGSHDFEFTIGPTPSGLLRLRTEAHEVVFANGLRLGMSFDEVKRRFPGYSGRGNPAEIVVEDAKGRPTIRLQFEDNSLRLFEHDAAGLEPAERGAARRAKRAAEEDSRIENPW